MTVNDWKLSKSNGTELGQVLSFVSGIDQRKVVTKALDGTVYIQTIGTGTKYSTISIFASREQQMLINQVEADGEALSVVYHGVRYVGFVESAPQWEAKTPGQWYTTSIKFLIEEEHPVVPPDPEPEPEPEADSFILGNIVPVITGLNTYFFGYYQ